MSIQKFVSANWVRRASLTLACAAALCHTVCAVTGPPVITQFSPWTGPVGDSITIVGQNLGGATEVDFNGVPAQFKAAFFIDGSVMLIATVPSTATTGPISVKTGQGTSSSSTSFTVIEAKPIIESFSPTSGPPGTRLIITGQNLKYVTSVLFNGHACDKWGPGIDGVSLLAYAPSSATTGPITVSGPSGEFTTQDAFTVTSRPPLTVEQWPTETETGSILSMTVNDSSLITGVQLNLESLNYFPPITATGVSILIPTNAVSGPLTLFSATGSLTSPEPLTVHPQPILSSISPSYGPAGTAVQLLGKNFGLVSDVWVGFWSVVFTNLADGLISFVAPSNVISGSISVFTPFNRTVSGFTFSVTVTSGQITTRPGTIRGPVPPTDPTPVTVITPTLIRSPSENSALRNVNHTARALRLNWPVGGMDLILVTNEGLDSGHWRPVQQQPSLLNGTYEFVVPISSSQGFFRLLPAAGFERTFP
jgi:hypothetical protein